MDTEQLIPNVSIEALLMRRERARQLCEQIESANRELDEMAREGTGISSPNLVIDGHGIRNRADEETMMKIVDRELWQYLLQGSGLWTFMDSIARRQWQEQRDKFDFPELTEDNVENAFQHIHTQRGDMLSRGVDELFQRLSGVHKTNTGKGFTTKVIREYMASVWGSGGYRHLTTGHDATNELDDLNRILHVLRGLPEPEHQQTNGYSLVSGAISDGYKRGEMIADFPFFTVRVFKKGTGHIVFKHDEDVKRLNKVLSIRYGGLRIAKARHEN